LDFGRRDGMKEFVMSRKFFNEGSGAVAVLGFSLKQSGVRRQRAVLNKPKKHRQ
jgi:hypothetical protein